MLYDIQSLERGIVVIAGSFQAEAAGVSVTKGSGFTAARAGAGEYTIVLDDTFYDYRSFTGTLALNAVDNWFVQMQSWTPATRTLAIKVVDTAAGPAYADPPTHANNRINFVAVMKQGTT